MEFVAEALDYLLGIPILGWGSQIDAAPFIWVPGVIWFLLKLILVFFMFAMVKAFVPRYRYDQLMRIGWKVFLPISLIMVVVVAGILQYTGWGWHGGVA
jgi:NADH-quinone oxidoreductase subunit H